MAAKFTSSEGEAFEATPHSFELVSIRSPEWIYTRCVTWPRSKLIRVRTEVREVRLLTGSVRIQLNFSNPITGPFLLITAEAQGAKVRGRSGSGKLRSAWFPTGGGGFEGRGGGRPDLLPLTPPPPSIFKPAVSWCTSVCEGREGPGSGSTGTLRSFLGSGSAPYHVFRFWLEPASFLPVKLAW